MDSVVSGQNAFHILIQKYKTTNPPTKNKNTTTIIILLDNYFLYKSALL